MLITMDISFPEVFMEFQQQQKKKKKEQTRVFLCMSIVWNVVCLS